MTRKQFAIMRVCAICLAILLHFGFAAEACGIDGSELLTQKVRAIKIKGETFDQVLGILTSDYGIPIGIEFGDPKLIGRHEIDLNLPETNLKEFLDTVISKDPRYRWKLEGGVIHVRPITGCDAFITTLLDTKISHFAFTEGATRYAIFNDILMLPEIQTQLIVADVAPMVFLNFGSMHRVGKGISFDESNLTLREMLDRIILKTDIKRWVIARWGENSEFITLKS
jgi:hypothetical protein